MTNELPSAVARSFRLGVNYWPARSAMGFWRRFDEEQVAQDFERIRQAGLDSVRLFLTWEDFQPSAQVIDQKTLESLKTTLDRALAAGLMVMPTLFTGHMSGANWFPAWAVQRQTSPQRFPIMCGGREVAAEPINWYTDATLLAAQTALAHECAAALSAHPALLAWDLGNENSNCMIPPSRDKARSWLSAMTQALRSQDPSTPITLGLHMEDLEEDRGLTPREAGGVCDFLTMHGYPGYASFSAGTTDERVLPFLAQLTRFLGGGKEVLFSEFGVPTLPEKALSGDASNASTEQRPELVSEKDAARYLSRGLRALQQSGASGAMIWCYSDYCQTLFADCPLDRATHERSFGLFHSNGSRKPAVDEVSAFASRYPKVVTHPRVQESDFIDLEPDDYYDAPRRHLKRLFSRYCSALGERAPFDQ